MKCLLSSTLAVFLSFGGSFLSAQTLPKKICDLPRITSPASDLYFEVSAACAGSKSITWGDLTKTFLASDGQTLLGATATTLGGIALGGVLKGSGASNYLAPLFSTGAVTGSGLIVDSSGVYEGLMRIDNSIVSGDGLTSSGGQITYDYSKTLASNSLAAGHCVFNTLGILCEGATADVNETQIAITDPTADRTITVPNTTGTLITTGDSATVTDTMISPAYSGVGSCTNQVPTALNRNAAPTCSAVSLTAMVSGILPIANGGLNLSSAADDTVPISNGTTYQSKTLPPCTDSTGNHLNYDTSTNTFSCGVSIPALTLAGSQFANQGTTTTVYHGNASGNGSFGSIAPADLSSGRPTWDSNSNFALDSGTWGTSAAKVLSFPAGTAPTTSPAAVVQCWSLAAQTSDDQLYCRNEAGAVERLTGLHVRCPSQFDKAANTTLGNITNCTVNVDAGKTYSCIAELEVTADATGGYKVSLGGTATATSTIYSIKAINEGTGLFTITARQTALAAPSGAATGTALNITISGTIVVNSAGYIGAMFAQNAATGTSSVLAGSKLDCWATGQ